MNRVRAIAWIVFAMCSLPSTIPSQASAVEFGSGADIARACGEGPTGAHYFSCLGFVHGVLVGYYKAQGSSYCKKGGKLSDEAQAVQKYAADHPEQLTESAARWVIEAAAETFPCH